MPYEVTVLACNKLKAGPWKFIIITLRSMWFYKYFDKIRVSYMLICYLDMSLAV